VHAALTRYMSGAGLMLHATAPTFDDIAEFLIDNPEADQPQGETLPSDPDNSDNSPAPARKKAGPPANPDPDEDPDTALEPIEEEDENVDPDDKLEDDDEDEDAKRDNQAKHKVTVKGEDGAEETLEVTLPELKNGYLRHSDYTRKAQRLATEKTQAFEIVTKKVGEAIEVAKRSHAAIVELAGLKTPAEMAALAAQDRGAYVEEKARQEAVLAVLQRIETDANQTQAQAQETLKAQAIEARDAAWKVLEAEGVKKEHLVPLFKTIGKAYGVPDEKFRNITDPALVLIMRDAAAYRALQAKVQGQAKTKLQAAPPVPKPRQQAPRKDKVNKALDAKFSRGNAGINDLSAWVRNNT